MCIKIFAICILASFIKDAFCQCIGSGYGVPGIASNLAIPAPSGSYSPPYIPGVWGENPWSGMALSGLDFSILNANGGRFNVQSSSPVAPSGITIQSDNIVEGALSVRGMFPFLSAVSLQGYLPSFGAGAVGYRCGNEIGIIAETFEPREILDDGVYGDSDKFIELLNPLPELNRGDYIEADNLRLINLGEGCW